MKPTAVLSAVGLLALVSASVALAFPSDTETAAYAYFHGGQEIRAMNSSSSDYTYIHYKPTAGDESFGASNRKSTNVSVVAAPIRETMNIGGTCGEDGHINVLLWQANTSVRIECWAYVKQVDNDYQPYAQAYVTTGFAGPIDMEFGPINWTFLDPTDFVVVTCSLPGNDLAKVVSVSTSTGDGC